MEFVCRGRQIKHIFTFLSPLGGPCPDGSLESIFPHPPVSHTTRRACYPSVSLHAAVFGLCSTGHDLYWLVFTLCKGQLGFFKSPANQVSFQKMCEIECLPTCEISPLSVD